MATRDETLVRRTEVTPADERAEVAAGDVEELHFTVASALLRELGERLVGQAHIALAELIKNAYDADATVVELVVGEDEIVVADNGHGMSYVAFRDYWMRIGSHHKERQRTSPNGRPLTGSKGVGRLAAQFLGHDLVVETATGRGRRLEADVNWDAAVEAGDLSEATALVRRQRKTGRFADTSPHGTRLTLRRLKQDWDADALRLLARELWPLRPPFRSAGSGTAAFDIRLSASLGDAEQVFEEQMEAILGLWDGRITGRLIPLNEDEGARPGGPRTLQMSVELGSEVQQLVQKLDPCRLDSLNYEIRVFDLRNRQPQGIRVGTAREYLNRFGGVHVYDAGFHLPYYGPDNDWLGVEMDHSHRVTRSKLLPEDLREQGSLTFLPTNSRLWGVVNIDTGEERDAARRRRARRDALTIQVTRDRLVSNSAYRDLRDAVRVGLDLYAVLEAQKHAGEIERLRPRESLPAKVQRVEEVLERYREELPARVYKTLAAEVGDVVARVETEAELTARRAGLLGALATAGISAVAAEHEFNRQLGSLERAVRRVTSAARQRDHETVLEVSKQLTLDLRRARETRRLFGSLLDEEDRTRRIRPRARALLDDVIETLGPFARQVEVDFADLGDVRLPAGTQAEWAALWQNLVVNAINAMLDAPSPALRASHSPSGGHHAITLEDTGMGVDVASSEQLFEPFRRHTQVSPERRNLGFGGTGLGLTIVRMLADALNCTVRFVEPSEGFATAVRVAWSAR